MHLNLWISIAIAACYEITEFITEELTASGKSVVAANAAAIFKKKKPTCEPLKISYLSLTVETRHHFLSAQIEMERGRVITWAFSWEAGLSRSNIWRNTQL